MKKFLLLISILASLTSISQDCEKVILENIELKSKIALLIDTNQISSIKSFNPSFNVEISNVIGNKNEQSVDIVLLISHSKVHQEVCINVGMNDCKAYDNQGNVYDSRGGQIGIKTCINAGSITSYACDKIPTGVPVKATITLRKVLSSTDSIKKMIVKIGYRDYEGNQQHLYGDIEIDNLKISWN